MNTLTADNSNTNADTAPPAAAQAVLKLLSNLSTGHLTVHLPNGLQRTFGPHVDYIQVARSAQVLTGRPAPLSRCTDASAFSPTTSLSPMGNLRKLFDLFEQKTQLMRLLDVSSQAEGVRIFIGGESQVVPFEELSVVSAPYEVDGQVVGTLGVIGPQRMHYDKMIQIVDITSKLVSNALSHHK